MINFDLPLIINHTTLFFFTDPRSTIKVSCLDGGIRLVNGSNPLEGRLEICFNRAWGTVCNTKFSNEDANATCNQLGFPFNGTELLNANDLSPVRSGPIFLDEVACHGSETRLEMCGATHGLYSCTHNEDTAIRCIG